MLEFDSGEGQRRVTLLGIPMDAGTSVPGARMGPTALRIAGLATLLRELGHEVEDAGDLVPPGPRSVSLAPEDAAACRNLEEVAGWVRLIHNRAYALAASGRLPIFLGGDHALSMGSVSGIARHCQEAGRELAVLWIDAHADFNNPATTPSRNMHGMSLAFLSGDARLRPLLPDRPLVPLAPGSVHIFGLRSIDMEERRQVQAYGAQAIDMRAIDEQGVAALMRPLIEDWKARGVHLHVSLDVDMLDPSLAPGVGTTVPGGATYREAHLIMEMLSDSGLTASLDVVELNPFLDERGRSARLLVELVASLFGRTVLDSPPVRMRAF
ncbi:arginase [Roseomonas marmotae]|uniref:Arginase n=1 Tax=Roseomonas marmotae TaxID=2768161 RepID=A0ABS3KED3_9PROT|nr:arginase [Roseomonas marmotae]MBO1075832.1 arginase [Roseomonas marmotae]QTI81975.1 arginase [Roseomonas marmotae]